MFKSLNFLISLLGLLVFSTNSSAQSFSAHDGKLDGPLAILKDSNLVFYLDTEGMPDDYSIGVWEEEIVAAFEKYNAIENTTISISYGGVMDGMCGEELPFNMPDPDREMICFTDHTPSPCRYVDYLY